MKNLKEVKINFVIGLAIIFLVINCSGFKEITIEQFKTMKSIPKNVSITLENEIAFEPHFGELIVDSSKILNELTFFLKKEQFKSINIITYFYPGGQKMMREAHINAFDLSTFLVKNGIDSLAIKFRAEINKKPKHPYNYIFRKVKFLLKK